MIKAKDIMTREVLTLTPDTEVTKAAKLLLQKGFNALPVVDKAGRLKGILCQSDLISQQEALPVPSYFTLLDSFIPLTSLKKIEREVQKIAATSVEQAMTPDPVTVGPDTPIEEIASLMVEKGFHTLPVLDEGKLVGVVGKEDILRTLVGQGD
ncbi:CBS domain-containing protein [Desulfoferula mesophila]|uniref:Membrane protein n=1 Tax=Desulfoferula mesophila TaxID=3058419 RepID=A0AAU9F2A7_9BACT|nr:membrane protein [Desulfoferula mesophilus]